jgi:hypothetical protein
MNKLIKIFITAIFAFSPLVSFSQSYEFHQGYIFEQKYIKRIPLNTAEKIAASPGVFNEFLAGNWDSEKISNSQIVRDGDRLTIKFKNRPSLTLCDYSVKPTETVEGDSQLFRYIKSVPNFLIIGVLFGHDAPGFLLIHESGSDVYFVDTY